ncbi:MAG: chromate efflux transporter, partial [Candidatus Rokubacteria bacterium]|nr:chromate efflux transporter [Candidatus Rokubacteria bacterium]
MARGPRPLAEVAALFFRLGCTAFGGPAAHIALMRDEVVRRRRWVTDQHFLDLLGATNLIPGPNSTEMAIHLGYVRAGWLGLLVGGVAFILPAMVMVLALAWTYVRYGALPAASGLLYGVKPVVIAVVAQAVWTLGRAAVKSAGLGAVGVIVLALYLVGFDEILLLFGGGLLGAAVVLAERRARASAAGVALALPLAAPSAASVVAAVAVPVALGTLFLTFLKIGAVLYGSGYVLLAFLRNDFVHRLGWLTDRQLLDAVAIGQFTPGPVFTAATFVGYVVAGVPGALLATLGIFLPAFVFVALANPLIPRLRRSRVTAALLGGVNVAAVGLMAAVAWQLGRAAIVDPLSAVLAGVAA